MGHLPEREHPLAGWTQGYVNTEFPEVDKHTVVIYAPIRGEYTPEKRRDIGLWVINLLSNNSAKEKKRTCTHGKASGIKCEPEVLTLRA